MIAEKIRAEIAMQRKKYREIANLLGVSHYTFYLKINGKRQFTIDELINISKILNKDPSFFLD